MVSWHSQPLLSSVVLQKTASAPPGTLLSQQAANPRAALYQQLLHIPESHFLAARYVGTKSVI